MELVGVLVAVAAVLGPVVGLRRVSPFPVGSLPLAVLSVWMVVLLTAGMLGHLRLGVLLVLGAGLLALGLELLKDARAVGATLRDPAILALGATALLLTVVLHGRVFTHYDNFSHWALVVKVMLAGDALPSADDAVVTFTTYPLGASGIAYLANTVVGPAEWVAMTAHGLLLASCALPLVSAAGRRWGVGCLLYAVATAALLTSISRPSSLLVDSLVAGMGAQLLLLVLLHRNELVRQPWALGVLGAALVTVKSSGVFFVLIATGLAVLLLWRSRAQVRSTRHRLAWAASLALPWLMWWAWSSHVTRSFPEAGSSKHGVSVDRFSEIVGDKTWADVSSIIGGLASSTLTHERLWVLLLLTLAMGVVTVRSRSLTSGSHRRIITVAVVTSGLWLLSLALMYLFSMPLGEALSLAGLHRYQGTLHLVLMLILLSVVALWTATTEATALPSVVAAVAIAGSASLAAPTSLLEHEDTTVRDTVEAALGGRTVGEGDVVCLVATDEDNGYRRWITRYLTLTPAVRSFVIDEDADQLPEGTGACDDVVVLDARIASRLDAAGVDR